MASDNEFTDGFLNDVEKDLLTQIADSPSMLNALKKVLLADVYFKGTLRAGMAPDPTRNAAIAFAFLNEKKTNEDLGQDIRALAEGVRLVEGGFTRLEKFKSAPGAKKPKENPAR